MERMQRRKKRVKWTRIILLILLLMIGSVGAYATYQYKQGVSLAEGGKFKDDTKKAKAFQGEDVKFGRINVLLLGSDSRGEEHARTDSIMIAHYDQDTHQSKLISIMRDTYVNIPGHGKQKINAAYAYGGPELLRQTIKENFDIDLNYYAIVDFEGFSKIADIIAPDGIEVDVPSKMSYGIGTTIEPGKQTLHGDKLLGYVRFRHDKLSDFGRVQRQQEVIGKLKDQAMNVGSILKLPKMLGVINPYVDTNLDTPTLLSLGKDLLTNQSNDIKTMRIPVDGSYTNKQFNNVGAVLSINLEQNESALNDFLSL
ncbi:LCP family protein [Neobacillus rhizophilus]|uniref:Regulatory protein MsrR n=1 Tax=Neobacillus rhizophilus TaxID=2833579 RepID=A0A942YY50_9BACI|nr:LCP family protein [Neobacillus rhizophilus]MBS4214561.1 LCP family protein [Neobacillus rhizophilus]